MGIVKNIVGQKFGDLTVVNLYGKTERKRCLWNCLCECGNYKIVPTASLKSGHVKSCGCFIKGERKRNGYQVKHKWSRTKLYACWISIKHRCSNPKFPAFKHYGGKGIIICKEWEFNFEAFKDWSLANGYQEHLTIDRKDSNKNYEPDNCRWATWVQQANNRSTNKFYLVKEELLTITQISEKYNIDRSIVKYYMLKNLDLNYLINDI